MAFRPTKTNMAAGVGKAPGKGTATPYKPRSTKQPAKAPSAKPGFGAPPKPGAGRVKPAARRPEGRRAQPDALYNERVDIADRKGSERLGQLDSQEQAVKKDFGIDDPTSPFSRMEGLKRSFLQRYRGVSAGLAAQGHLYSGQHERALARTRREEEEARANLRARYDEAIGAIGAARAGVKFDTEEQRAQAFEDWLARAPESEAVDSPFVLGESGASVSEVPFFQAPGGGQNQSGYVAPNMAAGVGSTRGGGTPPKVRGKAPKKIVKKKKTRR